MENNNSENKDDKNNINITLKNNNFSLMKWLFLIVFISIAYLTYAFLSGQNLTQHSGLIIKNYGERYQKFQNDFNSFFTKEYGNGNFAYNKNFRKVSNGKTIYYLKFNGDIQASQVQSLRKEVDAILEVANKNDEVVVNLESPGGSVTGYGLVASELSRFRKHHIKLVVVVDQVAASGGYMAASVANKIIAAPFAMVGSIGVVAEVPVFQKLLNKVGVDYKVYTAGDKKRMVTSYQEPTKKGSKEFEAKLASIHTQFKNHVLKYRPQVDINDASHGDFFSGKKALKLGLIDKIETSDEYLRNKYFNGYRILYIDYKNPENKTNSLIKTMAKSITDNVKEMLYNSNDILLK